MKEKTFKVSTFLNRTELDFLYTLEQDIYFNHNIRIPRSKLIQEIINALNKNNILDKQALQKELIQKFKENPENFKEEVQ